MGVFFASTPGTTVAMQEPAEPGQIVLPPLFRADPAITFNQQRVIITSLGLSQQVSQQFMTCLGGGIYVYVFGDQVGRFNLSGLMVPYSCNSGDKSHGLEKTLEFYNQTKLSRRKNGEPCRITIGSSLTVNAFLTAITARVADPQAKLLQFDMNYFILPDNALMSGKFAAIKGTAASTEKTATTQPSNKPPRGTYD